MRPTINTGKTFLTAALALLCLPALGQAQASELDNSDNAELAHALYLEQQGQSLRAISMIMLADDKQRLGQDRFQARLYLAVQLNEQGLQQQAATLLQQLAKSAATQQERNQVLLQQAKLNYELGEHRTAHQFLTQIKGRLEKEYRAEHDIIEAYSLLATGEIEKAVSALPSLSNDSLWALYQRYNFGVRLLNNEQHRKDGALILHGIGNLKTDNSNELLALKDQANLALGYSLLRINKAAAARNYLEKVRLKGPMAPMALLGMGWSYSIENNHQQALVFWQELQNRPLTNTYTYESFLAVPYALSQAKAYKQSLSRYESSKAYFEEAAHAIDNARQAINNGKLATLVSLQPETEIDWVRHWQAGDTLFLPLLMENRQFQQLLHDYRTLLQLNLFVASIKDETSELADHPGVKKTSAEISQLRMRQDQLANALQQTINKQQVQLNNNALAQLEHYKTQLQYYARQAQFGIAQVIEEAAFGMLIE